MLGELLARARLTTLVLQVSSSKVREALGNGRMARAEEYLGRRYCLVAEAPLTALQWPSSDVLW